MARKQDDPRRTEPGELESKPNQTQQPAPPAAEQAPGEASERARPALDLRVHTLRQENDESGGH